MSAAQQQTSSTRVRRHFVRLSPAAYEHDVSHTMKPTAAHMESDMAFLPRMLHRQSVFTLITREARNPRTMSKS